MCRTSEKTSCQPKKLQGHSETDNTAMTQVNYAARGSKKHTPEAKQQKKTSSKPPKHPNKTDVKCKYCGGKHARSRNKCPAYGQICSICNKRNHFSSVCQSSSKNVCQLDIDDSSDSESCYSVKTTRGKKWFTKVTMTMDDATCQDVICQLDSGSTCNVLGFKQYCILTQNDSPPLKPARKALRLYGGTSKLQVWELSTLCAR